MLTAPDNGLGDFTEAAVATTAANGSWSARLPAGPSRLVEASYAGAPTLEPSMSAQVHVVVPAKVRLISVSPRRVAWGGTVRIVGQLVGRVPAAGRGARAAADRLPLLVHDLRCAGARDRERQVRDHLHVRARRPERACARTGSRSPRCRWATTPGRRAIRGSGPCSSAATLDDPLSPLSVAPEPWPDPVVSTMATVRLRGWSAGF